MRAYELMEDLENDLQSFANQTKDALGLQEFRLHMLRGDIKLDTIIVGRDNRKVGVGSEAMSRLTDFADRHGKRIILSPAVKDTHHGTTSRSRLVNFYKKFGFQENKGRKKNFTVSASMIRNPKENVYEAGASGFKLYVDLDGVLVNFQKGASEFMADPQYGKEYVVQNYAMGQGQQSTVFWNKLAHVSKIAPEEAENVWASLDWMPDGKRLWDHVKKYNPIILSSPGTSSRDIIEAGKVKWINHNLKPFPEYVFLVEKWKLAKGKPGMQHILIDDRRKQLDPWVEHGGIGILHTDAASTIKELKTWGL